MCNFVKCVYSRKGTLCDHRHRICILFFARETTKKNIKMIGMDRSPLRLNFTVCVQVLPAIDEMECDETAVVVDLVCVLQ